MKMITKFFSLTLIICMTVLMNSCGDSTYYQGGNAEVRRDNIVLPYDNWVPNKDYDYQWYQEFQLSGWNLSENGVIVAFQKNRYGSWESLPMSTVLWTENGTIYSEELWYSFTDDGRFLVFDYRNTHPETPMPPTVDIPIKLFIIDDYLYSSIKQEGIDINNFDQFRAAVDASEYDVREVDFELKN